MKHNNACHLLKTQYIPDALPGLILTQPWFRRQGNWGSGRQNNYPSSHSRRGCAGEGSSQVSWCSVCLLHVRLSSSPCSQDPPAASPNEKKCILCNLDLTAGLGNNLFCDFPVKMKFFFKNSDSQRAEPGLLIGGEAATGGGVRTSGESGSTPSRPNWLCDLGQ